MKSGWQKTQITFAAMLVSVTVFFFIAIARDEIPLGPAMLCMLTWLVVPPTWLIVWAIRRSYHGPPGPGELAEMMIRESAAAARQHRADEATANKGPPP